MSEENTPPSPKSNGLDFLSSPSVAANDSKRLEIKKNIANARQSLLQKSNWVLEQDDEHDLVLHPDKTHPDVRIRNVFWLTNAEDTQIIRLAVPDFYSYDRPDINARDFANLVHCMNVITVKHHFIKIHQIRSSESWRLMMYYETLAPMGNLVNLVERAVKSMQKAIQDFYQVLPSSLRTNK